MINNLKLAIDRNLEYKIREKTRRNILLCIAILSILIISTSSLTSMKNKEMDLFKRTRVLFISAYDSSFPTFFDQLDGLRSVLDEEHYQIDIECMDSKRFYTKENLENFNERIEYKLSKLEPYDVILTGDDNALQYVMDHQQQLFKDIPIVFLGINDKDRAERAFLQGDITGVVELTSIKETLDLAASVSPNATELIIIVDNTTTGQGELKQVLYYDEFYSSIDFIVLDLSELSYDELGLMLEEYDNESIILLLSAYIDKEESSMTFYEYLSYLKYHSKVPIYHLYGFGIGNGILGGKVVDYFQQGFEAGMIVKKVATGLAPSSIEPIKDKSLNRTIIDYNVLVEFELDKNMLPIDTIFMNKPVSFLELNQEMILISSAVISIFLVILIVFILNILRTKATVIRLNRNNEELSISYKEIIEKNKELITTNKELITTIEKQATMNKNR